MGVPKFFRYISERYPCLSETVKEYQIPEFDNLYLDMNGIIHTCSHPDDGDPHFRITEEQIFKDIFHYIEVLFQMIRPRKLFFLAVDGVAPRAKMNQQRGRRFRSAKDATLLEDRAKAKGEVLPLEARFDSNCITPGTIFMAKLHEQLKYFIVNKISTDKAWQSCKVILSGHETPGEGEHKIMDYIRYLRAQPGYDPNTRHCLYGLDADLIMLGLCTHEPHFSLLREEVKFGKKSRRTNVPEQINFYLLHLSLMREYLELEFSPLKENLPFDFDLEKIIDDWVLMGFLVGNDFIPHLPNLHIHNGALPVLYNAYIKVLPTLDGYINESGTLNLMRFSRFMEELSQIDIDKFQETYADLKYLEGKTGRKMELFDVTDFPLDLSMNSASMNMNSDLVDLIKNTDDMFPESDNIDISGSESDEDFFKSEFKQHKTDYYMNKLDYAKVTPEVLRSQAEGYVRAIQWNLHYYYDGCCSWSWFYPHHYAPYISDIKNFSGLNLHFDLGKPFLPFQQLLAVLPSASKELLPAVYQKLMTDSDSPIVKYYPTDFQTDLNGKRQEWEAVVLIPFIEEQELLDAMAPCDKKLTDEEKRRNCHGPMLVYEYSITSNGTYDAPSYFPTVKNNHTNVIKLTIDDIRIPPNKLIKGAYPGAKYDIYFPGFPTFKHLKYTGTLQKGNVKVFDIPSRGDNMIVKVVPSENTSSISYLADTLLGRTIYVNWPHLTEAKVITISNNKERYELSNEAVSDKKYHVIENKDELLALWKLSLRNAQESYYTRLGIDVGPTEILVHALILTGRSYIFDSNGKFSLEKQWADVASTFPYQTVVQDISVHDPNFIQYKNIEEVYPVGGTCFMLGFPHYGSEGMVVDHSESIKTGRIKVTITALPEPDLTEVRKFDQELAIQYLSGYNAAQRLAISPHLFSRITGSIFIVLGHRISPVPENASKINVGLNLKFNKRNEEIPGYTKKDGSNWLYSIKAVQLVKDYMDFCPELFEFMADHTGNDVFFESEIFPDNIGEDKIKDIAAWIKKQPYSSIERQVSGSKLLDPDVISKLEANINDYLSGDIFGKSVTMQVKPRLLYMPELNIGNIPPDSKTEYFLYDRVVNVRESYTVPVGFKGTIIGIHEVQINNTKLNSQNNILYDVYFDQPFTGGLSLNCSANHGYRMSAVALINISHGLRLEQLKKGNVINQESKLTSTTNLNAWKKGSNNQSSASAFIPWNSNNNSDNKNSQIFRNKYPPISSKTHVDEPSPASSSSSLSSNIKQVSLSSLPKEAGPPIMVSKKKSETKSGISEFQAIWNELHKLGKKKTAAEDISQDSKSNISENKPSMDTPLDNKIALSNVSQEIGNETKKVLEMGKNNQSNDSSNTKILHRAVSLDTHEKNQKEIADSTEMLKMMLKIKDKPSENEPKVKPPKASLEACAKPVQELFERVKATVPKIPPSPKHYTVELLNIYQQYGLGIPRYHYLHSPERLIRAQIFLPNGQSLIGAPAATREQASEFVAQLVLQDHSLLSVDKNIYKGQFNSHLPAPPQQWFTRNIYMSNNSPRKASQNYSTNHQKNYSRTLSYNSDVHMNEKRNTNHTKINVHQEATITASKSKNDTSTLSSSLTATTDKRNNLTNQRVTPFVPLQAIKKQQRNRTLSGSDNKNQMSKENVVQKVADNNKKENTSSESSSLLDTVQENKSVSLTQKDTCTIIDSSTTTKPIVQKRVRKSRIAANFSGVTKS